ncbi:hypothetical protein EV283_2649 [Sphingomonas sp. BK036]|nr:hypothetical protein EV283_2649 [Sphingomonas sp. BK036]
MDSVSCGSARWATRPCLTAAATAVASNGAGGPMTGSANVNATVAGTADDGGAPSGSGLSGVVKASSMPPRGWVAAGTNDVTGRTTRSAAPSVAEGPSTRGSAGSDTGTSDRVTRPDQGAETDASATVAARATPASGAAPPRAAGTISVVASIPSSAEANASPTPTSAHAPARTATLVRGRDSDGPIAAANVMQSLSPSTRAGRFHYRAGGPDPAVIRSSRAPGSARARGFRSATARRSPGARVR